MAEVSSAYVTLLPSFRGGAARIAKELDGPAEAAGRQAGGKAGKGFGGTFLGGVKGLIGPLAGLLAGAGVVNFFSDSISAASDLGESVNAVNVVFGDAASGVLALGKNAAAAVGLSNTEFNGLAVRFSSFAQTVAGEGGDVVGTLKDLTTRSADFASVMNLDVAQATQIFQSGLAGESEPLRQFGIDLSAAAVQTFAYSNGIAKSGQQLTETQKVQARYGLLMQETANAQGDFANTSDSLANRQRILAAQFENVKVGVGDALLPAMTAITGFLTEKGLPAFQKITAGVKGLFDLLIGGDFTAEFGKAFNLQEDSGLVNFLFNVRDAAISLGTYLRDVVVPNVMAFASTARDTLLPPITQLVGWVRDSLIPGLVSLVGWLQQNEAWLKPIAVGVLAMVAAFRIYHTVMMVARAAAAAFALVQGVVNVVMAANPIGLVVLAIVGLIAALVYAWHNSETFRRIVTQAWEGIKAAASAVAAFFTKTIPALWNRITTWTTNAWNGILAFFRAIPGKIVQFFLNFTLPGLLIKHWSSIKEGATRGWNAVLDFIKAIPGRIITGLGNLGKLLYGAGRQILEGLANGIRDAVSRTVGAVRDAVGSVISGAKNLLGISSPSRVFMELGGYVAEGLAVGIDRGASQVSAATRRLVDLPHVSTSATVNSTLGFGAASSGAVELGARTIQSLGSVLDQHAAARSVEAVGSQRRAVALAGRR